MPHHTPLIGTIVAGLVFAFVLGAFAQRLRVGAETPLGRSPIIDEPETREGRAVVRVGGREGHAEVSKVTCHSTKAA